MEARTDAAHRWGQLQGRIAHLPPDVGHHFACGLVRLALVEALVQSGFSDAKSWFSHWFCGLESVPVLTAHVAAPAWMIADTLLSELSLSPWEPLAEAAGHIRRAARPDRGAGQQAAESPPPLAVEQAQRLAEQIRGEAEAGWPLAALDRLHRAAAGSRHFAPVERDHLAVSFLTGPVTLEQAPPNPPLWALDLVAGAAVARGNAGARPLPLPGAFRSEALRPEFWPRERAILVADAASRTARSLTDLVEAAHAAVRHMSATLGGLRSTSRAPMLYRMLAGYGPLRPIQIERALQLSKNGVRELVATLVRAGLVEMAAHRHQAIVRAVPPGRANDRTVEPDGKPEPAPNAAFAEFDAAMARIDRLLGPTLPRDEEDGEPDW